VATAVVAVAALGFCADVPPADPLETVATDESALAGQLLVAAPSMGDPRFDRAVILIVKHDANGAFGIIVNRAVGRGPASKLLEAIGRKADGPGQIRLHYGGPVQRDNGYIVHSPEIRDRKTVVVTRSIAVTNDPALLEAIATGRGPSRHFIAFGYAGWGPGQLEREIGERAWVTAPVSDPIVFDEDMETKWQRAMDAHGIDL
jgi:putative transcriptional regulator